MPSRKPTIRRMDFAHPSGQTAAAAPRNWRTASRREPCFGTTTASSGTCILNFLESNKAVSVENHAGLRWIITRKLMASRSNSSNNNTPYTVVRLQSWDEYLYIISDSPYQHWAFRGQRDASAPLFSALSRYFMAFHVDPRAWREQEERILRIFKRKAVHFIESVPHRDDDFEWLAL